MPLAFALAAGSFRDGTRVAATAPEEFTEATFGAIATGLQDEHGTVRHMATLAVFYAPWPAFLPLLREIASHDPDSEARRVALIAVDNLSAGDPTPR